MPGDPRICASIGARSTTELKSKILQALSQGAGLIEVRVDYLQRLDLSELNRILAPYLDHLLLTCRRRDEGGLFSDSEERRVKLIKRLLALKSRYVDIELQTLLYNTQLAELDGRKPAIIVSAHIFKSTPNPERLWEIYSDAKNLGQLVKIVTRANTLSDNARVLSLYQRAEKGRLIAFCTGRIGLLSRVLSVLLGSPFTYTSLHNSPTAPGQPDIREMSHLLNAIAPPD